jgi:SAM-dependent methyltransferase
MSTSEKSIPVLTKELWDHKHSIRDGHWVTGVSLADVMRFHKLVNDDFQGKDVLEIGVGKGNATRALRALASTLHCCDISDVALESIKTVADMTWHTSRLCDIPPVDIAFAHLVLHHCIDDEVVRIIDSVNLKPGGMFVFQHPQLKDGIITPRVQRECIDDGSHNFRTVERMQQLIDKTNKKLVSCTDPVYGGDCCGNWLNHEWYSMRVTPRTN